MKKISALKKIPNIGDALAREISAQKVLSRPYKELKFMDKHQISFLTYLSSNYPKRLKHCADAPIVLFYKGDLVWESKKIISIVGTRQSSDYGKEWCQYLIESWSKHQIVVVSGLAYGIDTVAHKSSLKYNIPTWGVMAHGFDNVYPKSNFNLAKKMLDNGGLITEFLSYTRPDRENFIRRNRIIAGLSDATLVIESASKGGALVTADIADSYHREVFTLPGRLGDSKSEGCLNLIKRSKAHMLTDPSDLIEIMGWECKKPEVQQSLRLFNAQEQLIVELLRKREHIHVDELNRILPLDHNQLSTILMNLELDQVIKLSPGMLYSLRNGSAIALVLKN